MMLYDDMRQNKHLGFPGLTKGISGGGSELQV
uniref:Uncharacterized protein n=1 Tax=Anguilla anguilla TaxID=7936 RepID=A0A0E9SLK1_ANGAN